MRVLIVGASGILAPAVASLSMRGDVVTGISRSRSADGFLRVDATDAEALSGALGTDTWDAAVVYGPATSPTSLRVIERVVAGPVVRVLTSAAASPGLPDPLAAASVLLLGWTGEPGHARWHTPEEVSNAAMDVLDSGTSVMLGRVRPWGDQPRAD